MTTEWVSSREESVNVGTVSVAECPFCGYECDIYHVDSVAANSGADDMAMDDYCDHYRSESSDGDMEFFSDEI